MATQIVYKKIHGCCKHGTTNGKKFKLKSKDKENRVDKPCYVCNICKKIYIDTEKEARGELKGYVNGYENYVKWNMVGPFPAPKKIYIYDKKSENGICSCPGKINKKTRTITHIIFKNGKTEPLTGAKVCNQCEKLFLTDTLYQNRKKMLDSNNIECIHLKNQSLSKISEHNKVENHKQIPSSIAQEGWEEEIFEEEGEELPKESLNLLAPASRVASAYYDAKISYNPYQYLPWLKMFINGSRNLLISDEVGLGKTIEAGILIMEELTENVNSKIIVICPAFLREKWYYELNEKFLLDAQIYDGKSTIDSMTNILILPVSRIHQYIEKENVFNYSMVIVDEVHYFKNSASARYKNLKKFLEKANDCKRVFMSATPVNNSGKDYHSIEQLFLIKSDRTNTTKKQAYIYLPERNIEDVYVELTEKEQEFYDVTDTLDHFTGTVYRHIGSSCLYALSRYAYSESELVSEVKEELRSSLEAIFDGHSLSEMDDFWCAMKKLPAPDEDSKIMKLKEILSSYKNGCKIVLFSHYIETVKYLHSELSGDFDTGYIYANTISNNIPCRNIKNKFIDAKEWFSKERDKTTILICSDTCREGIDLDVANILINYDLPFNPSILEQRIGRIDRMSQKKDMHIYNFHVKRTYDDRLHFILAAKLRFINFYADYGIGNPLNITSEGNYTFDSFIRYFRRKIEEGNNSIMMSNDDYYVASRILRQIGIKFQKENGIDASLMQTRLLEQLSKNKKLVEKWFDKGEIKKITEDQLLKQREELEKLLNFPKKIKRKIELDNNTLYAIVEKANKNAQFRKRISILIKNYADKLQEMEISGMPMTIGVNDLCAEYSFGNDEAYDCIPNSVIEFLRNEGAMIYDIR